MEREPKFVNLGNGQFGHEIKGDLATFALRNMFHPDARQLGGDKFSKVYFRTSSGNIYLLTDHGQLINSRESMRIGRVYLTNIEGERLVDEELVIGSIFNYGSDQWTTLLTEIVPTTSRVYSPHFFEGMENNSLKEDFEKAIDGLSWPDIGGFTRIRS